MLRAIVISALVYLAAFAAIVTTSRLGATLGGVEILVVFVLAVAVQAVLIKQNRLLRSRR